MIKRVIRQFEQIADVGFVQKDEINFFKKITQLFCAECD